MESTEIASTLVDPHPSEPLPIRIVERGWVSDSLVALGIRALLRSRLRSLDRAASEAFVAGLGAAPIALQTTRANQQHYEVPAAFFERVLGPRLKYSCAFFDGPDTPLAAAEERMLALTGERAGVADGMRILDLGCGWGSLSLWLAQALPSARILAVSNSNSQREFVSARARALGVTNLEVRTADANRFEPGQPFDRIVSVEMLEHARNWPLLLERMAGWLAPGGEVFIHVFCHRERAYPFETAGRADWMGRHFFSGGMMPSLDLVPRCAGAFDLADQWTVDGRHYQRTALAWLHNLDARRSEIREILAEVYGAEYAGLWLQRWRLFFLSVAELFGFAAGSEWLIGHYRLAPRRMQP